MDMNNQERKKNKEYRNQDIMEYWINNKNYARI